MTTKRQNYNRTFINYLLFLISSRSSVVPTALAFHTPSSLPVTFPIYKVATSTQLYDKRWGPRWNPTPDSEYYRRGNDDDLEGYSNIHFSGRRKKSKFVAVFGKSKIFSLQRFLVVSLYVFLSKTYYCLVLYCKMGG